MIRRPPRSTQSRSSAASDVYKRQREVRIYRSIKLNGFSLAKASNELGLSPKTISILGSRIREKLDFSSGPSPEDGQEISPVSPRRPRSPSENAEVSIPSPESEAFSQPG